MYTALARTVVRPLSIQRRYTTRLRESEVTDANTSTHTTARTAATPSLHNFFSQSATVVNKRKFNRARGQLHFIFLEGLPGTGKQGVLWRLNKVSIYYILKLLPYLSALLIGGSVRWALKFMFRLISITARACPHQTLPLHLLPRLDLPPHTLRCSHHSPQPHL